MIMNLYNSSRLHLFVLIFVQIASSMIFAVLFDMCIKYMHETAYITTHNLCMCLCGLDSHF